MVILRIILAYWGKTLIELIAKGNRPDRGGDKGLYHKDEYRIPWGLTAWGYLRGGHHGVIASKLKSFNHNETQSDNIPAKPMILASGLLETQF